MFTPGTPDPLRAIAAMLAAAALIAGTTILAKAIGQGVFGPALHPLQVSQGRFAFAVLGLAAAAAVLRPRIARPALALHAARSVCGWAGVSLMFTAVVYIPLSDATAISFLNPVIGMILAIPLLGERVGPIRWSAAAIAFAGAVILLRPGGGVIQPGALFALAAALALGLEAVFIKRLTGREAPLQILIVNNAIGLAISTVAALFVWAAPTPAQWAALAGIGFAMLGAQALFIQAMRAADASFALPFFYTVLIFATLYDAAWFGTLPDAVSLTGALVILAGALLLAWREGRLKRAGRLTTSAGSRS